MKKTVCMFFLKLAEPVSMWKLGNIVHLSQLIIHQILKIKDRLQPQTCL